MTEIEMIERVQAAIKAYSVRREIDASHPRAADTRVFNWPANAPAHFGVADSSTPGSGLELLVTIDVGYASMNDDIDETWSVTFLLWLGRGGQEDLGSFTKRGGGQRVVSFVLGADDPCMPLYLDALDAHAQGVGEHNIRGDIPGWA